MHLQLFRTMLKKQWLDHNILFTNKKKDKNKLNTNHKLQNFRGERQIIILIVKGAFDESS